MSSLVFLIWEMISKPSILRKFYPLLICLCPNISKQLNTIVLLHLHIHYSNDFILVVNN